MDWDGEEVGYMDLYKAGDRIETALENIGLEG